MTKLLLAALCVCLSGFAGMPPRPDVSDYAAHEQAGSLTLAAEALTGEQVGKTFATDLKKGWIVIEAAFYPRAGSADVAPSGFMLRVIRGGEKSFLRAASPDAVAGVLQREQSPSAPSDITLYPTVGVGYESGPGYYGGGRHMSVGLGVGIGQSGPPPPASTPADRKTMELELSEKSLPAGPTAKAVAGYLYFPRPSGSMKNAALELIYETKDGDLKLNLPAAR